MVLVPARPPTSPQRLGYLCRCSRERLKPSSVFSLLLSRLRYFEEGRYWEDREGAKKERKREDQGMFLAIYICILPTILTLPGISRLSPTTADYSADHAATKRRIETSCTGTKDLADTSAQFKKCFRKLTSLHTGAAFSLLPSRLRCLEEER